MPARSPPSSSAPSRGSAERFASAPALVEALETCTPDVPARPRTQACGTVLVAVALLACRGLVRGARARERRRRRGTAAMVRRRATRRSFLSAPTTVGHPAPRAPCSTRRSLVSRSAGDAPAWIYCHEAERGSTTCSSGSPIRRAQPPGRRFHVRAARTLEQEHGDGTSAGGRETFWCASPNPLPEIEADLARLPAAASGRPHHYPQVGEAC